MSVIVGSILIVMGVIFPQSPAQDSLNKGIKAFRDANYKSAIQHRSVRRLGCGARCLQSDEEAIRQAAMRK